MPRFSIIVPIYNIENYLRQCIDSILCQTYSDFQLILVDDGSKDSSVSICDEYKEKDKRIIVIHKKNGGLVSARQAGSNVATGDYIVCVDGDDWIEQNYLSTFNDYVEKYAPDILCCGYIKSGLTVNTKIPMNSRSGYYTREEIEKEIFPFLIQSKQVTYFLPTLWAKVIRREIYQKQQQAVDCVINIGEDGACVIPCVYYSNSLVVIDDCLYHYRVNESSMTKNKKSFPWIGPKLIADHIKNQIDIQTFDFEDQLNRKICHELFTVVTSHLFQSKKYRELRKDILNGIGATYYKKAVAAADFGSIFGKLMQRSLNYKYIMLIWIYSKFKHF